MYYLALSYGDVYCGLADRVAVDESKKDEAWIRHGGWERDFKWVTLMTKEQAEELYRRLGEHPAMSIKEYPLPPRQLLIDFSECTI